MNARLRSLFRSLGVGPILLRIWHGPAGRVRELATAGGPIVKRRTEAGQRAMEAAARELPPPPAGAGAPAELHLLTGRRFWYQSAFCLWSFAARSGRPVAPVVYDDGTLGPADQAALARLFPLARFVSPAETRERLERLLPASRYPHLRERWTNYPNIRKLTEPHLDAAGWKLVIDSDLLFFRRPQFLLDWLGAPDRPLHAVDYEQSYGYSEALLARLAGAPLAPLLNVGLCGLRSEELDWDRLERLCRELIEAEHASYYLEQALVAILLAGRECAVAPAADYVTLPVRPEAEECRAVMHHYVAGSKRWYFQRNWRRVLPGG